MPPTERIASEIQPVDRGTVRAPDPWIETLAWLMDSAVPVGRWSFGLDALVGLIPGFGDVAGALLSMFIVLRAAQAGLPRVAIARMFANIAIDTLVGAIPVVGDAFDFAWKANQKNLQIYRESIAGESDSGVRHWLFFLGLAAAVLAIVAIPIILLILLVRGIRLV
ncbi:MAG TPA: DUF4112 domain-containing protein [Bryobacteraceae bacterium]|jgi:hypothetical protein